MRSTCSSLLLILISSKALGAVHQDLHADSATLTTKHPSSALHVQAGAAQNFVVSTGDGGTLLVADQYGGQSEDEISADISSLIRDSRSSADSLSDTIDVTPNPLEPLSTGTGWDRDAMHLGDLDPKPIKNLVTWTAATGVPRQTPEQQNNSLRRACEDGYSNNSDILAALATLCTLRWDSTSPIVMAIGDSWFTYPGGHLLSFLREDNERRRVARLLNRATYGGQLIKDLRKQYKDLSYVLYYRKPHLLLVSYGGNDLLGKEHLPHLVRHRSDVDRDVNKTNTYLDYINLDRLEDVLDGIERYLKYLFSLRDEYSPETRIFIHTYDRVEPANRPAKTKYIGLPGLAEPGPWIFPVLDEAKQIAPQYQRKITDYLLDKLSKRIIQSANSTSNVFVVRTHNTLQPGAGQHWADEIHPTRRGFCELWMKWVDAIRQEMPVGRSDFLAAYQGQSEDICGQFGPAPSEPVGNGR